MTNYWRLLATWYRLKRFQFENSETVRLYQLDKFKRLIQHTYERVPMYREFYDSHNFNPLSVRDYDNLEEVPAITKDIIRSFPLEKRVDSRISKRDIHRETTSGSTGEPIEIWTDRTESLIQTLKVMRLLFEWGYSPFHNTVQLWRADAESKKSVLQKLGLFRRQIVSILDEPDTVVEALRQSRCDVLFATRSTLETFAEELSKRGVKLSPHILISCCELLGEEQRRSFKKAFGCEVLEIYGCVEAGNVAWACPTSPTSLHIDMETVIVNFRDVRSLSDGSKVGSVVVTNLENYVMPFIRYDLGDLIFLPENDRCSCGRTLPLLGRVLGRNDDVLEYRGRKYYFHFFYNYFKNYLYIKKYKIVQTKSGDIEFRIHLFHNTEEGRRRCLSDLTSAFSEHFSPLNVRFVDGFPLPPSGKFKVTEKLSDV